jgi:O-acetyl-ADP-ribose deacetylase (regulator of RNase III)
MQLTEHIQAKIGDITKECCDAIVNAANSSLLGGGGVDGAIHKAGGAKVLEACKALRVLSYPNGLPVGEAIATTAGSMCAHYVIHTVGPVYAECHEKCEALLSACYANALKEAIQLNCKSIAFPAISTGIYGYPKAEAAKIAFQSVQTFTQHNKIDVTFILHSKADFDTFISTVKALI